MLVRAALLVAYVTCLSAAWPQTSASFQNGEIFPSRQTEACNLPQWLVTESEVLKVHVRLSRFRGHVLKV